MIEAAATEAFSQPRAFFNMHIYIGKEITILIDDFHVYIYIERERERD